MTTDQSQVCLTAESMTRLAHGEFLAAEMTLIEEHLERCEKCRNMLESSLDSMWHDNVLPVLKTTAADSKRLHEDQGDGHEEQPLDSILKLLGPTDDPHKLGRIGTYEVTAVIGRGGMGVVFKAFDAALNRFVAIKMLLPHLAVSGAARKRFAREGQAAAAVIDDNVMPIYSVAEWQDVPYLVTQYCRGTTLQKRIQDQGPLELKEILRIGMQTARGLAAAHAQGLVHRDVKPSNILLDGTVERALLTDFGLARAVDDASITRTGVIAGTPQYMSPEQARGGSVDARSDLFGLGCVLYAMCTGRPPFRAENSYAVLRLITDEEPRPIREINPEIPEWLCRLIHRLMAKSPNDRFSSAAEVATLLEQCLAHVQQPTVAQVPEQLQSKKTAGQRIRSGRSMVAIGALLLGILGLFGVVISLQSQDGTLLIESSVDDVTVKVSQGDTVVRKLTVTKAGTKINVAAGSYLVEIEGNVDGIAIENNKVNLRRGQTEIVKLTYQRPVETASPQVGSTTAEVGSSEQQLKLMEDAIFVTDVRAEGQVLYFTLNQRNFPEGALGVLQVQFLCEEAMPFTWTGPGPDAKTVLLPQHSVAFVGTGSPLIALPLASQGYKVAFIFPDNDSAAVAAMQLASCGDISLLAAQRRANSKNGGQEDKGIIFGNHPSIGKFKTAFRILVRENGSPEQPGHGIQRPQFVGVNWRPLYLAIATHHHTAKRHALSESQEQEIRKLFDEFVRTATIETHDELLELTQAKIQEVLTREQDVAVRREIWLGWNVTKFRDPKIMLQLQISSKQQQQIDAIWQALERQTGQIQDPSSPTNIPEFFRLHRFAVEGPEQWQRVFDEIFAILTIQQRGEFLSEIQDPIVDGLLTDPRQRALAVPHGVIHEIPASPGLQMQQAFPTVNWRQLYIGRAMEPQLAKQYQITAEQQQRMHEIAQAFLREATPATRETQEKLAQSAIQALLSPEQDQLLRKEIWLAVNASRLRSSAVHDQLGLDIHQRRQIDEAFEKFEAEVRQNNGWLADGTDSHQSLFDAISAVLTAKQRELYFTKLQDPVFSTTPLSRIPRDWNPEDFHPKDDSTAPAATLQSQLQGVWRLSGWAYNDGELEKVADPADDFRQIVFRGNVAEFTLVDGTSARFTYTIDASSSPAAIDWKPEGTDLTLLGLVELSNGTLKLSMSNNETPVSGRPSRLAPEIGSGYFEFRRDAAVDAGQPQPDAAETASIRLLDVLKQDMEHELSRFPLLDYYREDLRLLEGGGLEVLEKPVKEDREQYAKDHPDLAKAFEAWQSDYRDVIRVTEVIPELFDDNNNAHEMMVTVAKLLIESEDIPGVPKERLAEAHIQLGENPTDETVEKLFLGLAKDQLFNLQRKLRESGANVPHTGMHEDHLRIAEEAKTHIEFARLYCAIEQSEMFRQIRKLQESVDPATVFLFEESHPIKDDETLVFFSSRGREEVRAGERGYHALVDPSATVTWKVAEQDFRLKNADAVQVTHVIVDRRMDGMVVWRCYGIPAGSTAPKVQDGSSQSSLAPDGDAEPKDTKAILGPRQYRLTVTRLVDDANQLVVTLRIESVEPQWFEIWSGDNYWHRGSQERWIANLADERSADGRYFSKLLTFTATQIANDNKRLTRLTLEGTPIVYDLPLDWAVDKSLLITAKDGVYEFLHPLVIGKLANQTELKLCVGDRESVAAISLTSDRNGMVSDSLSAVLPSEGIVDLNVLANSTEEAKVRMANRQLRDPNAALLAELQGTWLMTAIVAADGTIESVSDPVSTGHSIHFKGSTVALDQGNDEEPLPLNFTIDASTPTPEIDIEGHDGIFTLGLVETQNGTLHLQLGEAGGERPSDSIKAVVHYQYRRIPASLIALGEQKTEGALNPEDLQQQEAVIREANHQLKDPNRVLLAQLQGSWTATAMILPNGQLGTVSKPAETGMTIRFDDKAGYISQGIGEDESKFTYTIDASTSPAEIDLKYSDGTHALGLVEIKNGTLELQLGAGGDARPSPEVKPSIHQLYRRTSVYWQWIPARE